MHESINPEYIGIENGVFLIEGSVFRFKFDFSGVMTELRFDTITNEWTLLVTDEIAQSFGYLDLNQFLESDLFLDALIRAKSEWNRNNTPLIKIKAVKHITN